jgi:hypothetical protein
LKFLADECCDTDLVASLRKDGHDVLYVTEKKAGAIDDEILSDAYDEKIRKRFFSERSPCGDISRLPQKYQTCSS